MKTIKRIVKAMPRGMTIGSIVWLTFNTLLIVLVMQDMISPTIVYDNITIAMSTGLVIMISIISVMFVTSTTIHTVRYYRWLLAVERRNPDHYRKDFMS